MLSGENSEFSPAREAVRSDLHASASASSSSSVATHPRCPVIDRRSGRVYFESWLDKKPQWRFAWDRRYVTLDGNRIAYRLEEDAAEKGSGTAASLDCNTDKSDLVFRVWLLEGGSWTLRAPDLTVYKQWLEALLTALRPTSLAYGEPANDASRTPQRARQSSENPLGGNEYEGVVPMASTHYVPLGFAEDDNREATSATTSTTSTPQQHRSSASDSAWGPAQLTAQVEKQAAWTGRWKRRVLELHEGNQLAYKAKLDGSVRQRYTVTAMDLAVRTAALATSSNSHLAAQVGALLLFSTSTGERFWVKFSTTEECREWYQAIYSVLQRRCSWHWLTLPEDSVPPVPLLPEGLSPSTTIGANLVLDSNGNHNYINFKVHHHCAAVAPLTTSSGGAGPNGMGYCLYVYGGANRECRCRFQPQAKTLVPSPIVKCVVSSLSMLQLFGSHSEQALQILPFEEALHVKVRPPPLFGATMTAVYTKTKGAQLNRISFSAVQLVVVGGLSSDSTLAGLPHSELWSAILAPSMNPRSDGANTSLPQFKQFWRRLTLPTYELPSLAFHGATDVSRTVTSALRRLRPQTDDTEGIATASATILLTGGLDENLRTRAECYCLHWPYNELSGKESTLPTARFFGYLPEARAFHGMATLRDGTVVLVGGRGVRNDDVTPILTLPPSMLEDYANEKTDTNPNSKKANFCKDEQHAFDTDDSVSPWQKVQWHCDQWPLPSMPDVAVAATESGDRVVALAQFTNPRSQVKLFVLSFQEIPEGTEKSGQLPRHTLQVRWQEIVLKVGAIPRSVNGASIHVCNGYIYVIGANGNTECQLNDSTPVSTLGEISENEPGERLCGPLRLLMSPP